NGTSLRDKAFAYNTKLNALSSRVAILANSGFFGNLIKKCLQVASQRRLPHVSSFNFNKHLQIKQNELVKKGKVILYIDEFTRYTDIEIGKDAIDLLSGLG